MATSSNDQLHRNAVVQGGPRRQLLATFKELLAWYDLSEAEQRRPLRDPLASFLHSMIEHPNVSTEWVTDIVEAFNPLPVNVAVMYRRFISFLLPTCRENERLDFFRLVHICQVMIYFCRHMPHPTYTNDDFTRMAADFVAPYRMTVS